MEDGDCPDFNGFGKNSVIGVTEGFVSDGKGSVEVQQLHIDENPHQFDNCQSRMSVVELNGCLLGKVTPLSLPLLEPPDDVLKSGTHEEVLLFQSQFLPLVGTVIWIQH